MYKHVALISLALLAVAAAEARPDRNAFLNKPASSVQALVAQAKADRTVMDRYRRHFHMTAAEVVGYLSNLRLARLEKPGVYQIYSVPPDNRIKLHAETLRVGVPVYIDVAGKPVMVVKCGNPLATGPKKPTLLADEEEKLASKPTDELRDLNDEETVTPNSQDMVVMTTPPLPLDVPLVETTGASAIPVSAIPSLVNLLLGAGGIGAGVVLLGDNDDNLPPVPEPTSIAALAVGSAALIARRRRRR